MNTRELMESKHRQQRGEVVTLPTPPVTGEASETATESSETVELLTEREIKRLLRKTTEEHQKVAIVKVAVAFLAVKYKLPVQLGSELDETDEVTQ